MAAGRSGWRAHRQGAMAVITYDLISTNKKILVRASDLIIRYGASVLLIFAPLLANAVSKDLGIAALVMFFLLLLRLIFGYKLWFIFLRLLLYVAMAFTLYLLHAFPPELVDIPTVVDYLFYGIIAAALVITAGSTVTEAFQVTPTDFLVVLVLIGMGLLAQFHVGEFDLTPLIIKMVIMFYAIELVLRNMTSRICVLTLAALWTFGVIGFRGVV